LLLELAAGRDSVGALLLFALKINSGWSGMNPGIHRIPRSAARLQGYGCATASSERSVDHGVGVRRIHVNCGVCVDTFCRSDT
jgi:hypothetical protein